MPGPKPPPLLLSDQQRSVLEKLALRHRTPQQLAQRARLVLAAGSGLNNSQIGRLIGLEPDAVRLWRNRWLSFAAIPLAELSIEERLKDVPRAGKPSAITPEQFCQIVALACQLPEQSARPITHWSPRELAAEIVKRGILTKISPRHAARLLKKGISNPTGCAAG